MTPSRTATRQAKFNASNPARPSTRRLLMAGMALGLSSLSGLNASAQVTPTSQTEGVQFNVNGNVTNITAPDQAIINYSSFNVAGNETVNFLQPGASARVLNRINSATPSQIDGGLNANGIVYLVNPAGVTFGAGSVVNAGGLYAAAGNISDADFASGINQFTGLTGAVNSYGTINAESITALLGREVNHGGNINVPAGTVVMGAGDSVLLGSINGGVYVSVEVGPNAGEGGVDVSGNVKANDISLISGDLYSMAVSGFLDASSDTGQGGTVEVTGKTVALTGTIDASGATGGGTIRVGGGWQGDPLNTSDAATADRTFVGSDATLDASAIAGDGGVIVVWAEDATWYYGMADASAASVGDGGQVEVSGKTALAFEGDVNVSALEGVAGTILLDPENITIVAGGPGADDAEALDGSILFADRPGEDLVISEQALEALGGALVLQANNDILLLQEMSDGVLDLTGATSVTVEAGNNITINAPGTDIETGLAPTQLNATNDVTLLLANFEGVSVTAGGTVDLEASGDAEVGNISAGGDLFITTTTSFVETGDLTAGGIVDIVGFAGVDILGEVSAGVAGVQIAADTVGIRFNQDVTTTGGPVDLEANAGNVEIGNPGPVTILTGGGAFTSSGFNFTNNGTINTRVTPTVPDPAGVVTLNHTGTVDSGTILAGDANLGSVTTTGAFSFENDGDIFFESIISTNGSVTLRSNNGDVSGSFVDGEVSAAGDIDIFADGMFDTGTAGITSTNGSVRIEAGGDIIVGDTEGLSNTRITSARGITLRSGSNLFVGDLQTTAPGQTLDIEFFFNFGGNQLDSPFAFETVRLFGTSAGGGIITGDNGGIGWGGGDTLLEINSSNGQLGGQNLVLEVDGFDDVVIGANSNSGDINDLSDDPLSIGQGQTLTIITDTNTGGAGRVFINENPFTDGNNSGGFSVDANDSTIILNSVNTQGGQTYSASGGIFLGNDNSTNGGTVSIASESGDGFVTFNDDVTTNNNNGLTVTGNTLSFQDVTTQGDINLTGGVGGVEINSIVDSNGGNITITTNQVAFTQTPTITKPTEGDLVFFTRGGDLIITPFETVGVADGSLVFDSATNPAAEPDGNGNISFGSVNVPQGSLLVNASGNTTIDKTIEQLNATVNARGGAGFLLEAAGGNGGPFNSAFGNIAEVNGVRIDSDTLTLNHGTANAVVIQSTNGLVIINANNVVLNPGTERGIVAVPNLANATINPPDIQPNFVITTDLFDANEITLDLNQLIERGLQQGTVEGYSAVRVLSELRLSEADLDTLQRMNINARDLESNERMAAAQGALLIDDVPDKAGDLTADDYRVAIARIDPAVVRQTLALYREVLMANVNDNGEGEQRNEEIRAGLLEVMNAYANAGNEVGEDYDPARFRAFLLTQEGGEQLAADLEGVQQLIGTIDRIGMNEIEEQNSMDKVVMLVLPEGTITLEQMRATILGSTGGESTEEDPAGADAGALLGQ